jgi:hypothetical protein
MSLIEVILPFKHAQKKNIKAYKVFLFDLIVFYF